MYQLTQTDAVIRLADCACIPADGENIDWQEYQEWLQDGGQPLPFDPDWPGVPA